jgi:hypothetical protein
MALQRTNAQFDAEITQTIVGKYGRIRPYSFVHDSCTLLLLFCSNSHSALAPSVWSSLAAKLGTIPFPAQIRCSNSYSPYALVPRSALRSLFRCSNESQRESGSTRVSSFGVFRFNSLLWPAPPNKAL